MRRGLGAALAALLVLLCVSGAQAQRSDLPPGLLLVLEGYLGPRRADDWGVTQLWLYSRTHSRSFRFQLQHLRVVNSGILPNQIILTLSPNRPSLFLYGQKATLDILASATPVDRVTITGYTSRMLELMVSEITVSGPGVTPSSTAPVPTPGN